MKKLLAFFLVFLVLFGASCSNQQSGMSDKAKKNLDNFNGVTKMFETQDFSRAGDYLAADAVDHSSPTGDVKGLDSIKAMFTSYGSMVSDVKNEQVKELADDDYVIGWIKQSWTAKTDDPPMHMKAGDKGQMESIQVTKHNAEGKITDHWSFMSMNDVMKMMPNMGNMGMDTSKMKMDTTRH
jgi:predicted SnoaL-like aldol condensation-catalyzing enzyme